MARLPWRKAEPAASEAAGQTLPLPRPPTVEHHWLTLVVARPAPAGPVPVAGARVVVRAYPRGAPRPTEPVARGTAGPDGTVTLHLPAGRYAVSASHDDEARGVTITLEHAGRAMILLEGLGRRVVLTAEVTGPDGSALGGARVEVRTTPARALAAEGHTDERGVASLLLPPGAYEVRVGETLAKTYVEADTLLRLSADAPRIDAPAVATSRYAQKARQAVAYVAPFDLACLRDDQLN